MRIVPLFPGFRSDRRAYAVLFMSGSGSNAEVLLRAENSDLPYQIGAIVTDNPKNSRAVELAERFQKQLIALDIHDFYAARGEASIALVSDRRRELRALWTEELRRLIAPLAPDFGILAGFVPLCNITGDFPCLNVHPGDLTRENPDGTRRYAGLHFLPVERAILDGNAFLRSSVILAQSYSGSGKTEMDSGPVLGVSRGVEIDLDGVSLAELTGIFSARRTSPFHDRLREVAQKNLEKLKFAGDHTVFPPVVEDFAAGRFGSDSSGRLNFRMDDGTWIPMRTVEYSAAGRIPVK